MWGCILYDSTDVYSLNCIYRVGCIILQDPLKLVEATTTVCNLPNASIVANTIKSANNTQYDAKVHKKSIHIGRNMHTYMQKKCDIVCKNIKKCIFKESALGRFFHRVAMSVCVFVPLFMWYILRPIFPPLPGVGCPKFLEIQNPWGKVLERSGLRIEHFCWEVV